MRSRMTVAMMLVFCAAAAFADAGFSSGSHAFVANSAQFVLQLGVLVFAAKTGGALFDRWRLPVVLGELLAGVLVGPHLLGRVALPFFPKGLMCDVDVLLTPNGSVFSVVTLTLVVLFFLVGLDTDVRQIRHYSVGGILAGLFGFALSFGATLATLILVVVPLTDFHATWSSPLALLFSTVISVTSVGLMARMLAARQRLETPAGVVALTAAMTDNVIGLFCFAVFSGVAQSVAQGTEPSFSLVVSTAASTVIGLGIVALVGFPIARHMNALALRDKKYAGAFIVASACLLMAGGCMGVSGLSVMAGAYVMGIAFSSTDLRHEIRERLDFVSVVLVPACFAALGMQLNPNLLGHGGILMASVLFVAVASAAKVIGCAVPSGLAGLNRFGCLRVGVLSMPRGELSLAMLAALMGFATLPEGLFFALILTVAVSCVCASFLTQRVFLFGGNDVNGRSPVLEPVRIEFRFPSHQAAMLMVGRAVEIFEDEGFYAHLLSRHQVLYRISRDAQVITLRRTEGEVVFECSERERNLVNTVMLEIASGVEQSLRELQRPLDDVALRKNMQRTDQAGASSGVLRNKFLPETLKTRLLSTTKQGVISELVGVLYENGLIVDRERAVKAVFERENSLSTGLEFGVAIPHARTDAVQQLVCAVGLKKEGLAFDALDGQPVRIVVLVLAPESAPSPQLQFIAQMCRLLNETGRAALLACESSEDMYGVLTGGMAGSGLVPEKKSIIAACLQWQSIALDMAASDRNQVVSLLLALCARSGSVGAMEGVRRDIQALPKVKTETLMTGVTLLSVETQNVYRMVAALGVRAQSVTVSDGGERACVMVLYPASAAEDVVRFKAALTRALEGAGLTSLLFAKTSKEALDILLKSGG